MRTSDVVLQLQAKLPQLTPLFTDEIAVTSLTSSGTVITAQCADPHGLEPGGAVAIAGSVVPITISSFTRVAGIGKIVTATDHDLTKLIAPTITTSGATEPEFNGTFTLHSILNRRTIAVVMTDSGPLLATGSPVLENAESYLRSYNNTYQVQSTPTLTSFTFNHSSATMPAAMGTIVARANPRITGAVEPTELIRYYTEQKKDDFWMFVIRGNNDASKNRQIESDATENQPSNVAFRQQVIQSFGIYVLAPAQHQIAARGIMDEMSDLLPLICRAILGKKFDSGFAVGEQGRTNYVSDSPFSYDGAVYAHLFEFDQVCDLNDDDTVGPDDDVAFRDIEFDIPFVGEVS